MLNFVAKAFRTGMSIILWLMLIGFALGPAIFLGAVSSYRGFNAGMFVLGLLGGSVVGLIFVILTGGLIANFLNMVDNVADIKNRLERKSSGDKPLGSDTQAANA